MSNSYEVKKIRFRDYYLKEIPKTTYSTHNIYYYPAKFIPQVVRYCIDKYTKEGDRVLDPFGGSGTVALEASFMNRFSCVVDINPMLSYILPAKLGIKSKISSVTALSIVDDLFKEVDEYVPSWKGLKDWYSDEIYLVLSRLWCGVHKLYENDYKKIIQAALVKVSRKYSEHNHTKPKLFRSKSKRKQCADWYETGSWKVSLPSDFRKYVVGFIDDVDDFLTRKKACDFEYFQADSSRNFPDVKTYQCLISSPPYLQAQEYFRSNRLELYWLGETEETIKKLQKLEIPYRGWNREISTPLLDDLRFKIRTEVLDKKKAEKQLDVLNSYFDHMLSSYENALQKLDYGGYACIFVGSPKSGDFLVEIWRIIVEYFSIRGFKVVDVFDDSIEARSLAGGRNNSNPDGMESEFLLVLKKEKSMHSNYNCILDSVEESSEYKILKSPLGLAKDLIANIFVKNFDEVVDKLDNIKRYAAGVGSAQREELKGNALAELYPSFFARHQFFQSSFRARQGKVLESFLAVVLESFFSAQVVMGGGDLHKYTSNLWGSSKSCKDDMDIIATWSNFRKILDAEDVLEREQIVPDCLIQIRSRDDTGGTTAKGSLVTYAKKTCEARSPDSSDYLDLIYIVCVWDDTSTTQKDSLIDKCFDILKDFVPGKGEEEKKKFFKDGFEKGMSFDKDEKLVFGGVNLRNVHVQLVYGYQSLLKELVVLNRLEDGEKILSEAEKLFETLYSWDDLWLSYLVGDFEMKAWKEYGKTTFDVIWEILEEDEVWKNKVLSGNFSPVELSMYLCSKWNSDNVKVIPYASPHKICQYLEAVLALYRIHRKININ